MDFNHNPHLNFKFCLNCQGTGLIKNRECPVCRGYGVGVVIDNVFYYLGEHYNDYFITRKKWLKKLKKFQVFVGLALSLSLGVIFFLFEYPDLMSWPGYHLLDLFLYLQHHWYDSLIWFSFWFLLYFIYRLKVLPDKIYEFDKKNILPNLEISNQDLNLDLNKELIKKYKNKINISRFFSKETDQVITNSYLLAKQFSNQFIQPIHIFFSLLSDVEVSNLFIRLGISSNLLQAKIKELFIKQNNGNIQPVFNESSRNLIFNSYFIALEFKDNLIRPIELLVSVIKEDQNLQDLLFNLGLDEEKLKNIVNWQLIKERLRQQYIKFRSAASRVNKHGMDKAMTAVATPFLNHFSQDLTLLAKYGRLDLCIDREKETEEIFRLINSGAKAIILVGDSGVGKMTIIEGLTQKMIEESKKLPRVFRDKRLVQLLVPNLLAGADIPTAQQRLLRIINEVRRSGNIILFIKNIHDLIGINDNRGMGLDISEALIDYINNSANVIVLATTTSTDYRHYIANSPLVNVFSKVEIKEMNYNQALKVLEAKVFEVEYKQKVYFTYDSLETCASLADKFFYEQNLPKSALDLMSESAAYVRAKKGEHSFVTKEDVAVLVSQKTGVQVTSITEDESEKLLRLESEMHRRIIGQDEAVALVANALRRARTELRSNNRPIANFLFLGPTGVGKTELAKTIADVYFGDENKMIRIDMSEYQDQTSIYRLIGQPNQQGTGLLTEAVRQNPFSLVLLDELEKADSNVLNLFLQVFDDGRLTDSVGRVIDFTNTIIIATSNAGTNYVQEQLKKGRDLNLIKDDIIKGELKKYYRPEFLNRFDGIVLFKPLTRENIKQIAGLMLNKLAKKLEQKGIEFHYNDLALEALVDVGYDPEFGARPMRRAIQDYVENKLAELILQGKLQRRTLVQLGEGLNINISQA